MEKSFLERIGERLRDFRESKGYRPEEVAAHCGVQKNYIYAIENGTYKPPYSLYEDICRTIGITTQDLFGCFKWKYAPPQEHERGDYQYRQLLPI